MTDRWQDVVRIFDEALARPAEGREAFLREACGGDEALATEVRSLLEHHDASTGFLETAGAATEAERVSMPRLAPGETVGAWRIERPLGQGGMGVVYLVERQDGGFRQRGALKLIRAGLVTDEMVRRFLRERQILASLEHPNIARLLDGGTTAREMPYLVMEYVDGEPLYEYCSSRGLSVDERLALFERVCEAVSHAHRRLVLHRDLKPGNLMVTSEGEPKLLDFGIGKVFDEVAPGATADPGSMHSPMTPEYASPEQLRNGEVTTAADVYALGVLLYELLTGVRPFPPSRDPIEHARRIAERGPARPSTAVSTASRAPVDAALAADRRRLPDPPGGGPHQLRKRLAGDLDTIVLKAMHPEPERRYATVDALVEDLRRCREGLPVLARPDSWRYRAGKFVARHRVAVAAATFAVLALVGGLAAALWQASVATHERGVAERRYRQVRTLANTLLFEIQDSLATRPGTMPVRELMIARAQASLDSLATEAHGDTTLLLDLVDAYHRLAMVQGLSGVATNLGKKDEARANLVHARSLAEELLRERPNDPRVLRAMIRVLTGLGNLATDPQHADGGLEMLHRALDYNQRLLAMSPDDSTYQHEIIVRRYNIGNALWAALRRDEARAQMGEAIVEMDSFVAHRPQAELARRHLAHFTFFFGQLHTETGGSRDTALMMLERSGALVSQLLREHPGDVPLRFLDARIHSVGATLTWLTFDDPVRALKHAEISDSALVTLAKIDPGNQDVVFSCWVSRFLVGYMAAAAGQADRAEPMIRAGMRDWSTRFRDARYRDTAIAEIQSGFDALSYVEEARARDAAAAGRSPLPHWRRARQLLARSAAMFDSLNAAGEQGTQVGEQRVLFTRRLARIDSVMVAERVGR